jgi:hypothetical protein
VHLAFDIFQGIGIAAAVGIRPFLPALVVGLLAIGDIQIDFHHTSFNFLQQLPFLLAVFVGFALLLVVERSARGGDLRRGPLAVLVMAIAAAIGAFEFAGALAQRPHHYAYWPGFIAGAVCVAIGLAASRPFLERLRARLDADAAAFGVPLIAEGAALIVAVLSALAPPVGVVALIGLVGLTARGRQRAEQKYAGLRILR